MRKSPKLILVTFLILVSCGVIGIISILWSEGYLDPMPPRTTQYPILYPNAQNTTITKPAIGAKQGYDFMSFDTTDEPLKVKQFYQKAFEADGWVGDSDTGGPTELRLQRCYNPHCNERYILNLRAESTDGNLTHVKIRISLVPHPPDIGP